MLGHLASLADSPAALAVGLAIVISGILAFGTVLERSERFDPDPGGGQSLAVGGVTPPEPKVLEPIALRYALPKDDDGEAAA